MAAVTWLTGRPASPQAAGLPQGAQQSAPVHVMLDMAKAVADMKRLLVLDAAWTGAGTRSDGAACSPLRRTGGSRRRRQASLNRRGAFDHGAGPCPCARGSAMDGAKELWRRRWTRPLRRMRRDYAAAGLAEADALADPIAQFERWFDDARRAGLHEPNAMTLATVDAAGQPAARMVLLKGVDARGLSFFTNRDSRKARELSANPRAALVFWWGPLQRQVRFEGTIEEVDAAEADAYFASRPKGSQLAAWASAQST